VVTWGVARNKAGVIPWRRRCCWKMHRLNVLREHTWQDMTCTVEAGCPGLGCSLAWHNMASASRWIRFGPSTPRWAGIVATNDSGALG